MISKQGKHPNSRNGFKTLNKRGYTKDNCVPSCKQCNIIKMDYTYLDFTNKIKQIYDYLNLKAS